MFKFKKRHRFFYHYNVTAFNAKGEPTNIICGTFNTDRKISSSESYKDVLEWIVNENDVDINRVVVNAMNLLHVVPWWAFWVDTTK